MKRFWKQAGHEPVDGGCRVVLDGRPVRTPARGELIVPGKAIADAIAAEWNAVEEEIDPAAMPMTGFANAAIDRVRPDRTAFIDEIANYSNSDMLCYRADSPRELAERQAASWEPLLDWARRKHNVDFVIVSGILHKDQPDETRSRLRAVAEAHSDHELAALSKITTLSGSAVAALALADRATDAETVWQASIVDELWQEEQWGDDDFALKHRADRANDFMAAARYLTLVQDGAERV